MINFVNIKNEMNLIVFQKINIKILISKFYFDKHEHDIYDKL